MSKRALSERRCFLALVAISVLGKAEALTDRPSTPSNSAQNIPIEINSNKPYVNVQVNDQSCWFLLDTGASFNVLDKERAEALGIASSGQSEESGAGEGRLSSAVATGVTLGLPGLALFNPRIAVVGLNAAISRAEGRRVDGLLGYDFFKQFVVEIDYAGRRITTHQPSSFRYRGQGQRIPLKIVREHALVSATLDFPDGRRLPGQFMVDTAWRSALTLNAPFVKTERVAAGVKRTIEATTGVGIGGPTKDAIGRVESLRLGRYTVSRPIVALSSARAGINADQSFSGIIGGDLLRRLKVVFDYSRQEMIVEPNDGWSKPYEFDMSGMFLIATGTQLDRVQVYEALPGSPAFEAGIRDGDLIAAVDNRPASELTLEQIRAMFREREGREYLLTIRRGEDSFELKIRLRRLI